MKNICVFFLNKKNHGWNQFSDLVKWKEIYIMQRMQLTLCLQGRLLITFANSLDPDQARNVRPDLDQTV